MKKLLFVALLCLVGATAVWAQTGTLNVTVVTMIDEVQTPVAGALVVADGHGHGHDRPHFQGMTDENGFISFPDIPATEYEVRAGAPGYPPVESDEFDLADGETYELTLTLVAVAQEPHMIVFPDHDVHFGPVGVGTTFTRVVHVRNNGFADLNVAVAVAGEAFALASEAEFTLSPDPMNNEAEVLVTFTPADLLEYTGTLTLTSNDPEHGTVELELDGIGATIVTGGLSVDVVVADSTGATTPVDSARVRVAFIRDHGGPRPQHFVGWTDANGHLDIPEIPVGLYNVNASKRGIGFASEDVDIVEGQTAFATLTLVAADSGGHHGHPGGRASSGHHFEWLTSPVW
ncbi:MAG: carboxypeptidase regulatory-like domain-containing protein [bacterium]|nr:carboxypeptidase regulatory-like domain-containing protein [bacterium]